MIRKYWWRVSLSLLFLGPTIAFVRFVWITALGYSGTSMLVDSWDKLWIFPFTIITTLLCLLPLSAPFWLDRTW